MNKVTINRLIELAEEIAGIQLTPQARREAIQIFDKNFSSINELTALDRANIALLGVISVAIAGGIEPVVQYNPGNLYDVPDFNPYDGGSNGPQAIDFEKTLCYLQADPEGLQNQTILNLEMQSPMAPDLEAWLVENNYLENAQANRNTMTPVPRPYPPMRED